MSKTIIIGEDKVLIAEHLKEIVASFGYEVLGIYHNKASLLKAITERQPDIALLDIRMESNYTGVEIGEFIVQNYDFPFIYVTAHSDKLTLETALKTKPNGYILKPFKEIEIKIAIELAFETAVNKLPKFMIIKDGTKQIKVPCEKILYLKSDDNYVEVVTQGHKYLTRATLKELCAEINNDIFIRTHRSFVVSKNHVTKFDKKNIFIKEIKIPVSKKYIDKVKNIFNSTLLN